MRLLITRSSAVLLALALVPGLLAQDGELPTEKVPGSCQPYQPAGYSSPLSMCGQRHRTTHYQNPGTDEERLVPAVSYEDGCSCASGCGFTATCCPDAVEYCGVEIPPGTQITQPTSPASVYSGIMLREGTTQRSVLIDDGQTVAGLTRVNLTELDTGGERSTCRIRSLHPNNEAADDPYWVVESQVSGRASNDDNMAFCDALGMRLTAPVETEYHSVYQGDGDDPPTDINTGKDSSWWPLMTFVRMEDIDAYGEKALCDTYYNTSQNRWHIRAWSSKDDSDAWCGYRFVNLSSVSVSRPMPASSCPAPFDPNNDIPAIEETEKVLDSGSYASCNHSGYPAVWTAEAHNGGSHYTNRAIISMMPTADHACFLHSIRLEDVDDRIEPGDCEIYAQAGKWWLKARSSDDSDTVCKARCLRFRSPGETPSTNNYAYSAEHPAGYKQWPVKRTHATEVAVPGKSKPVYLELYQSGEYDKPIVFFEGFDPVNKNSIAYHERLVGPMMTELRELGWDVWMVELSSGGEDVAEVAREDATAIDYAYKYNEWNQQNPGREIAVAGVSMGALAGRILLASWEDGRYNCDYADNDSARECLSPNLGDGSSTPPVSVLLAINGPQTGANIPLSLQTIVQDVGRNYDLGEPYKAVNARSAINMLNTRLSNKCRSVVMESCGGGMTFKDGTTDVRGNECLSGFYEAVDGCTNWAMTWNSDLKAGCADLDGDGVGSGQNCDVLDCDDDDASVSPLLDETCGDKKDNNCDGNIDETCPETDCATDADEDGAFVGKDCANPDCDDTDPMRSPYYEEVLDDDLDHDCDGDPAGGKSYEWTCVGEVAATHDEFYDSAADGYGKGVNLRGPSGNGYPSTVITVGLSNGGWLPQGCSNMRDWPYHCPDTWYVFQNQQELGSLIFQDDGHTIFGACDRHSNVYAHLTDDDLVAGDLSGRTLEGMGLANLPKQVSRMDIMQRFPFVFVPSESALHCPLPPDVASNPSAWPQWADENCAANSPFDYVAWNRGEGDTSVHAGSYNGFHDSLTQPLVAKTLAFLWDALEEDADGYCSPSNPFFEASITEASGSYDGKAACLGEEALEVCDGIDNDGNGGIDDGVEGCDEDEDGWSIPMGDCNDSPNDPDASLMNPGEPEVCDGLDNNCDGQIDEEFHVGEVCTIGLGPCQRSGVMVCQANGTSACNADVVEPGVEDSSATCHDGIDNDCDGRADCQDRSCCSSFWCEDHAVCQGCFAGGTKISMADGSEQAIESVQIGDHVLSYDEASESIVPAEVTATFVHENQQPLLRVNDDLEVTANHPFFVNGHWVVAEDLVPGSEILRLNRPESKELPGFVRTIVSSISGIPVAGQVFNIEVDVQHNYFANGVLVHNKEKPKKMKEQDAEGDGD